MTLIQRSYDFDRDFHAVGQLLIRHYQPDNRDGNWLQPAWEYMHYHPSLERDTLPHIGIWEDDGAIVAVAHHEWELGEAFFQLHPAYPHLKAALLDYANARLARPTADGPQLNLFINDFDHEFEALARSRGFSPAANGNRPMAVYPIPVPFPAITLPDGFRLKSLADDFDLPKMHRVLWRGFDHPGPPPPEGIVWREIMTAGPTFRPDLTIVVEAPDGHFVSFCGLWYEPVNQYAYVEPLATDPDYRQMGLGRAAMMEGIRRCAAEGATVAYVGSDQPFYLACGFVKLFDSRPWSASDGA